MQSRAVCGAALFFVGRGSITFHPLPNVRRPYGTGARHEGTPLGVKG